MLKKVTSLDLIMLEKRREKIEKDLKLLQKEYLKGLDAEIQDMKDRDPVNYSMGFSRHSPVAIKDGFLKRAIKGLFQRER